jgi:carboxylesterase
VNDDSTSWSRKLAERLLAHRAFDRIIPRHINHLDDLVQSRPIVSPGNVPTVLCLHGFTGVPEEVRLGCEVAQSLGLAACAPLLPGHGTSALDLGRTRFVDWLSAATSAFDELRARGPVVLVGLSMGSLLATELTLRAPGDVAGLVLMSNAFWLKAPYPAWGLYGAEALGLKRVQIAKEGADIGDPSAKQSHVTYTAQPLSGAWEVLRAGERLRERLRDIHRPTLVLHGARDRVCPVDNAWRAAERLGTSDVRVVIFPRSHHIITRDREHQRVRAELERFLRELPEVRAS